MYVFLVPLSPLGPSSYDMGIACSLSLLLSDDNETQSMNNSYTLLENSPELLDIKMNKVSYKLTSGVADSSEEELKLHQ